MQVFAKLTNGRTLTLEVEDYMTGAAVKQLILEQEKVAVKRLMVMELVNKEVADNRALGYYLPRAGLIIDPETGVLTGTTTVEGVEGESSVDLFIRGLATNASGHSSARLRVKVEGEADPAAAAEPAGAKFKLQGAGKDGVGSQVNGFYKTGCK